MKNYLVTFRSVTFAQRGERVLRSGGIRCALQRTPRALEERGCGYSLALNRGDLEVALDLLRRAQVPMRKVYLRDPDGTVTEVGL